MRRLVATAGWLVVLVGVLALVGGAGDGALAPPPADPARWAAWAEGRTTLEAVAALLRLGVLVVGGYLLATTVLGLLANGLRWRRLAAAVSALSPPVVRGVVRGALGAGLVGAVATPAVAMAGGAASPPPTMVQLPEDGPVPPPPTTTTTTTVVPAPAPPAPAPDRAPVPPRSDTATIGAGDHLWAVAERTLAATWGQPPADGEVAPYWRLLVELNRPGLPDPADPDLVFPGDVVRLPAPPPAPG